MEEVTVLPTVITQTGVDIHRYICSNLLGARLPWPNGRGLVGDNVNHLICRQDAVEFGRAGRLPEPSMILVDVIQVFRPRDDLDDAFVITLLIVVPRSV